VTGCRASDGLALPERTAELLDRERELLEPVALPGRLVGPAAQVHRLVGERHQRFGGVVRAHQFCIDSRDYDHERDDR
jgi:hypothetical protein